MDDPEIRTLLDRICVVGIAAAGGKTSRSSTGNTGFAWVLARMTELYDPNDPQVMIRFANLNSVPTNTPSASRAAYYFMLGDMYLNLEEYTKARSPLEIALSELETIGANPRLLAYFHHMLVTVCAPDRVALFANSNNRRDAIQHSNMAVQLDPSNRLYREINDDIRSVRF